MPDSVYIKIGDVCRIVGLKRWAVYNNIRKQGFPKPVKLNGRVARWIETDVRAWVEARK